MTDKKKIEILQEENARLRKELGRVNYLLSNNVKEYVDEFEKENRKLYIELSELENEYKQNNVVVKRMLKDLKKIHRREKIKGWKFWER